MFDDLKLEAFVYDYSLFSQTLLKAIGEREPPALMLGEKGLERAHIVVALANNT